MKIALLIGVSEYYNSLNQLPACKNDVEAINDIVKNVAKYDEVMLVNSSTTSSEIIPIIRSFVDKYKNQRIDELFFYFSGHGLYSEDELFYILSDFKPSAKRRTGLLNSELDSMFKSLNPELMIKVIDACHSGVSYIKDGNNSLQKLLESSKQEYKRCYFMFSSQKEQSSYIGDGAKFSKFTESFIKALVYDNKNSIRYKDIVNFISDDFDNDNLQTPLFINQAIFTEDFAEISKEQKEYIKSNLLTDTIHTDEIQENTSDETDLTAVIKNDSLRYIQENMIAQIFEELDDIYKNHSFCSTISDLYNTKEQLYKCENKVSTYEIKRTKEIGEWLQNNKHQFFAQPTFKNKEFRRKISAPKRGLLGMVSLEYEDRELIETKKVIDAFEPTCMQQPYYAIKLSFIPKKEYQNIKQYDVTSVFLLSKLELKIFYYYGTYKETSWNYFEPVDDVNWQSVTIPLIDFANKKTEIVNILDEFEKYIIELLKKEFLKPVDE